MNKILKGIGLIIFFPLCMIGLFLFWLWSLFAKTVNTRGDING